MNRLSADVFPKYRQLVTDYESATRDHLKNGLAQMFSEVEPTMIDFASKAETDNAQVRFFDAISHIRNLSEFVTRNYFDTLTTGFGEFISGRPIHYPKPIIETDSAGRIGIVDDNDLEVHIAIQAMIEKSTSKHYQSLYQLGQRLAIIRQGRRLARPDIPASPDHLAITFQRVAADFVLEHKLLLILYVLFEKRVLGNIGTLYVEINRLFSDAGIYPNLTPMVSLIQGKSEKRNRRVSTDTKARSSTDTEFPPTVRSAPLTNKDFAIGAEVFRSILSLLTERLKTDPRFKNHPEYRPGGNLAQLRSKPDLVRAINQLDTPRHLDMGVDATATAAAATAADRNAASIEYLQQRIANEREVIYRTLDTNTIQTADLDTIELVGMLFEHVLDDQDLASITKALICHLHTPYLKVAILNQEFLSNPEHIARKLLNLVVNGGRRWVDENNLETGIYHTMRDLIQTIMSDFKDDVSIFEKFHDEFLDHLRALEQKTKILEERTREATQGKDRLEYSRLRADAVLRQQCAGVRFQPVLWGFLSSVWKNYMTLLLLRDQKIEQHRQWRTVLMVINSIIKLNNAYADARTREWLKHAWPGLRKNIESGLNFLGDNNPSEYIALREAVQGLLQGREAAAVEKVAVRSDTIANVHAEETALKTAHSKRLLAYRVQVQQTDIGTWFEFTAPDGKLLRVKKSWYSPITNNHMFIDRFGSKAFMLSTDELVKRLDNETVRIITPNRYPFVDQTLKKIYRLLRAGKSISAVGD
jgi:hypothetical protein